ncbi:MAG: hypothetical protein WCX74_00260 [Candidatus Paceibacterota bacterium]
MTNIEEFTKIWNEIIRFGSSPMFNWSTFLIAVIISGGSILFAIKARRIKLPVYDTRTFNLIKGKIEKIDEIKIIYKNSNINNFSITKIALWNKGKDTISKNDIASADKLRIVPLNGTQLLDAEIIYEKNNINKFSLNLSNKEREIIINFDFFDFEEGVVLQVFHTGKSGNDISMKGTIKGFGPIKRNNFFPYVISKPFLFLEGIHIKYKKYLLALLCILTPIIFLLSEILPKNEPKNVFLSTYLPILVIFIMYWHTAYILLKKRVPKGFSLFEEDIDRL